MANESAIDHSTDELAVELNAYNAAFYELGLRWHWDADAYRQLVDDCPVATERVRCYLARHQPHLLKAYDADFLSAAIESKKAQCRKAMADSGIGHRSYFNWAESTAAELGA